MQAEASYKNVKTGSRFKTQTCCSLFTQIFQPTCSPQNVKFYDSLGFYYIILEILSLKKLLLFKVGLQIFHLQKEQNKHPRPEGRALQDKRKNVFCNFIF